MTRSLRVLGLGMTIPLIGLAGLGCATPAPPSLEARGPGTVFSSIDAAAVDALTYTYLQAVAAHDTERMRGGAIRRVEGGFSYDEVREAGPLAPYRVRTALEERDVARFLIYYRTGRRKADRANERPSQADRRFVRFVDPLHRPLYILHPSLVIRVYRGEEGELVDVADLRHPEQGLLMARE